MQEARILIVEDNVDVAAGMRDALQMEGYGVTVCGEGRRALAEVARRQHELMILDLMLPGMSGFDILEEMRRQSTDLPVLIVSARGQESDKVRGLKLGADDYLPKPFGLNELLARVEVQLRRRRSGRTSVPPLLETARVRVDFRARQAWRDGRSINLTSREFEILEVLAARRGEAVPRSDLVARIWGPAAAGQVTTRTVDQHVGALRRKLGDPPDEGRIIQTIYGFGYRLAKAS